MYINLRTGNVSRGAATVSYYRLCAVAVAVIRQTHRNIVVTQRFALGLLVGGDPGAGAAIGLICGGLMRVVRAHTNTTSVATARAVGAMETEVAQCCTTVGG